jgi:hypothetical protein
MPESADQRALKRDAPYAPWGGEASILDPRYQLVALARRELRTGQDAASVEGAAKRLVRATCRPLLIFVQERSELTLDPVRRDNSFAEKQESHPARLLVVPSGSVRQWRACARIRAESGREFGKSAADGAPSESGSASARAGLVVRRRRRWPWPSGQGCP